MVWDATTGEMKRTIERERFVSAVAVSPNGKLIVSSGGNGEVELWEAESGKRMTTLRGLERRLHRAVAFARDGKTVATGGPDGKVRLWDATTGKLTATLVGHGSEIYSIAFSPAGTMLASVSEDRAIRLWPLSEQVR